MLNNPMTKLAVLILVASGAIWIGAEFTRRIVWITPYTAGVGALLFVAGVAWQARLRRNAEVAAFQARHAATAQDAAATTPRESDPEPR